MTSRKRSPRATTRERVGVGCLVSYAILCVALSLPGGARLGDQAVWNNTHNKSQFKQWSKGLRSVGLDWSTQELKSDLWSFTSTYLKVRNGLLRQIRWLPEQLGFSQSWKMFSNPQTHPSRLWIELDTGKGFEPIYIARSPQFAWQRAALQHHRIRKLIGRVGRGGRDSAYRALGHWLAQRAKHDFPNARRLRIRVYTWKTPAPDQTVHWSSKRPSSVPYAMPGGKFRRSRTFALSSLPTP